MKLIRKRLGWKDRACSAQMEQDKGNDPELQTDSTGITNTANASSKAQRKKKLNGGHQKDIWCCTYSGNTVCANRRSYSASTVIPPTTSHAAKKTGCVSMQQDLAWLMRVFPNIFPLTAEQRNHNANLGLSRLPLCRTPLFETARSVSGRAPTQLQRLLWNPLGPQCLINDH